MVAAAALVPYLGRGRRGHTVSWGGSLAARGRAVLDARERFQGVGEKICPFLRLAGPADRCAAPGSWLRSSQSCAAIASAAFFHDAPGARAARVSCFFAAQNVLPNPSVSDAESRLIKGLQAIRGENSFLCPFRRRTSASPRDSAWPAPHRPERIPCARSRPVHAQRREGAALRNPSVAPSPPAPASAPRLPPLSPAHYQLGNIT
jgi:hypothetical protein